MSIHAHASICIRCPPEQVFAVLENVAHYPNWASGAGEIQRLSENPARLGARWIQINHVLGKTIEGEAQVHIHEPGRRFGFRGERPFPAESVFTLTPQDEATRVDFDVEAAPRGVFRFAGPMLRHVIHEQIHRDLESLKSMLEA